MLSCGIVGLPNVGKSTLFNSLLKKQQALVANYPFATIEPNIGVVPVPDARLVQLQKIERDSIASLQNDNTKPPIVPATVEFVDIAGLVKGASEGAGLGNKFLSHIREVNVIVHVVRAFVDENIIREGSSDPENDYATIQTELLLADLQTAKNVTSKQKRFDDPVHKEALGKLVFNLDTGIPARQVKFSDEEKEYIQTLSLLTSKQELIVLNVNEDQYTPIEEEILVNRYVELLQVPKSNITVICAKIESDLMALSADEQIQYLSELGFSTSGLERLIQKAYQTLGLISFLTAGEKEVRAWTIKKGDTALQAAGVIHTDFMKKFIKAEVVSFDDFVNFGGWKKAREVGKARFEGRDYIMQDGDVVEFKIGA